MSQTIYKSFSELAATTAYLCRFARDTYFADGSETVIATWPRGGLPLAAVGAHALDTKEVLLLNDSVRLEKELKHRTVNLVIIDDIIDTGSTIERTETLVHVVRQLAGVNIVTVTMLSPISRGSIADLPQVKTGDELSGRTPNMNVITMAALHDPRWVVFEWETYAHGPVNSRNTIKTKEV